MAGGFGMYARNFLAAQGQYRPDTDTPRTVSEKQQASNTTGKYLVGRTLADNTPCLLVDGDSVFCVFPGTPDRMDEALDVCAALNSLSTPISGQNEG